MFRIGRILKTVARPLMAIKRNFQVTVVGASRPLGQHVSFLLKQHPLIHRLAQFDIPEETSGVATDPYIPSEPLVEGWTGRMDFALLGSDLVVVTGGNSRKQGQTDLSLFRENADFIISAMQKVTLCCPSAFIAIATEPINYIVPLATKVLEHGITAYDKNRVLGVTGHDTMRTQTWVSDIYKVPPCQVKVPVICGHSSKTIIPLLSHVEPRFEIDRCRASTITESVRNIEDSAASLSSGEDSMRSMAHATYCTASAILAAMNGFAMENVAFVANNEYGTKFFASPVIITCQGIFARMQFHFVTPLEADYIYHATEQLGSEVRSGELYYMPTCK